MSLSRVVLGCLLALGIVGMSADAAQAQYYGANNYNNRFGGGGVRHYPTYSAPRQVYIAPSYNYTPYYAPSYFPPVNRSYYNNTGFNRYNSGFNQYNPGFSQFGGNREYSFGFGFGSYYR